MRWSQTLIPTQKQDPADATVASHKLLVRGGFIRQLQAGVYDFLPLGWRVMRKVMEIVREEMVAAGATEVFLPVLQPIDLWDKSGRNAIYGDDMLRSKDRKGAVNALAPTHEEAVTELIAAYVNSYKQLPLNLFQIQTKFRDEPRPRSGLLRVREFFMKDAYSFDADVAGLDESYRRMYDAYVKIYRRCGIPAVPVEAESGPIGGSASHEFTVPCDAGEDTILSSDKGNYAANAEKAETGTREVTADGGPTGELEKVRTPGMKTIEDVGKFLKAKPQHILKTLVYKAKDDGRGGSDQWLLAIVRGDHEVNEAKLSQVVLRDRARRLEPVDEAEATAAGFAVGFLGPHAAIGQNDVMVIADYDAVQGGKFWVAGANELDYHVKHFDWKRDFVNGTATHPPVRLAGGDPSHPGVKASGSVGGNRGDIHVADIRNAVAGDPSPKNDGGVLRESKGVEVGHVFKLGTRYSEKLGATFLDADNKEKPVLMGCYGIGIGRIVLSAVEVGHDDRGILWPNAIAPYQVVITPIKYDGEMKDAADKLYDELTAGGCRCVARRPRRPAGQQVRRRGFDRHPRPHNGRRPRAQNGRGRTQGAPCRRAAERKARRRRRRGPPAHRRVVRVNKVSRSGGAFATRLAPKFPPVPATLARDLL